MPRAPDPEVTPISHPFPRARRYDPAWSITHSLGENVLYLAEAAGEALRLAPGARVLDAGCGRGISSVFLAREYGARVIGVDREPPAPDVGAPGVTFRQVDLAAFTDAEGFDAIVCLDSFFEFGLDERVLARIRQALRPGGALCIVDAILLRPIDDAEVPPDALDAWRNDYAVVPTLDTLRAYLAANGFRVERAGPLAASDLIRDEHARARADDSAEASVIAFQRAMPTATALVVARRA